MDSVFEILKLANRLEKEYKKKSLEPSIKIAVVGSISLQHFVKVIRYQLDQKGIISEIYEGEYNGISMDVFQDNSPLYEFKPNIIIILCHYTDIKVYPYILADDDNIYNLIENTVQYYENVWKKLSEKLDCTILQSNYPLPCEQLLGNLEKKVKYSKSSFLNFVNKRMQEKQKSNVIIVDVDSLSNIIGKLNWFDYSAYFLHKLGCRLDYIAEYCRLFSSIIINQAGKIKKCLVLDLDNTLWGGIVGDVGYDGIQIDPNNAVGESFRYFQQYLKDLKRRGVILAICSKNDDNIAKEPFQKNENMVLKLDDFSCFIANWDNKASNIKKIAETLNIGLDSLVFFDDNPVERDIVKSFLPEVHVIDVPDDPANYVRQLDYEQPFNWASITKEDLLRSNSYIKNVKRAKLMENFIDYNQYLIALCMEGECGILNEKDIGRYTQLINKSNQFNLRTQRYTEGQIVSFVNERSKCCIFVKLKDKYSDYGLISCIILDIGDNEVFVDSWVMSCRVLKRSVEKFAFKFVLEQCNLLGCSIIHAEYLQSPKNMMVKNFYESLGFTLVAEQEGRKEYKYIIGQSIFDKECFIKEKENCHEY